MADLRTKLPPHCQVKKRKNYLDVYFMPHPKDRAKNWPPTIHLGRTDKTDSVTIIKKSEEIYREYTEFINREVDGENIRIKEGSLPDIISKYKSSSYFTDLAECTKRDYDFFINDIQEWSIRAGNPHIKHLTPKSIVKWLNKWDDKPRRQKYAKAVMSVIFGAAIREGYVDNNFIKEIKLKRQKSSGRNKIKLWTHDDVDLFINECDRRKRYSLGSMVLTGIETAQRKGDIIKMRNGVDYHNGKLVYVQQKTGTKVSFNATKKLSKRLEKHRSRQMFMFINERTGKIWDSSDMTHVIKEICDFIGLTGFVFKNLRNSQITYLYEIGCSVNQISAISGHTPTSIDLVLEKHYLEVRNEKLANEGVARIDKVRQKSQTRSQTKATNKAGNRS